MKKKLIVFFITSVVISVALSVTAIILSVTSINRHKDYTIKDAYAVGLGSFFGDTVSDMYISAWGNPNLRGDFYDEEVLAQVRDIFSVACLQGGLDVDYAEEIIDNNLKAGGVSSWIDFTGQRAKYSFYVCAGILRVKVDDQINYYHTNVIFKLTQFIDETAEKLFASGQLNQLPIST